VRESRGLIIVIQAALGPNEMKDVLIDTTVDVLSMCIIGDQLDWQSENTNRVVATSCTHADKSPFAILS